MIGSALRTWLHLRAAFVAFHLLAIVLVALPAVGGGLNRDAWSSATVQAELRAWAHRLNALGAEFTVDQLQDRLWRLAVRYERGRRDVLAPFVPYLRYTGTAQFWRMFVAPHRYPGRLRIEVDRGDGFEPIYEARSSTWAWRRAMLDHARMRSAVFRAAWPHFRVSRRELVSWLERLAASDFPDAQRLRVSFLRYRTRSPEEVRAGREVAVTPELVSVRDLDRVRALPAERGQR